MTDNQIIKALECCADEMGCKKGCPCFDPKAKGSCCTISKIGIEKIALDLINRQQAEIERLQKVKEQIKKEKNKILDAQMFLAKICDNLEKKLKTAKAEAIKEYTEKLEAKLYPLGMVDSGRYLIQAMAVKTQIDRVKEKMLKGGDNDETKR